MKKTQLTPKQQKVYDYFIGDGCYNLSATARHFKRSTSTIHQILQTLVAKGWLVNEKWQSPAYRPTIEEVSDYARGYQLGYQKGVKDTASEVEKMIWDFFHKLNDNCFPEGSVNGKIVGDTHYYQKYGNKLLDQIVRLKEQ